MSKKKLETLKVAEKRCIKLGTKIIKLRNEADRLTQEIRKLLSEYSKGEN